MTTTSIIYDLVDTLLTVFQGSLSATVLDGYGLTDLPGDYVMVGVEDPDTDRATSAETQQSWAGLGAKARDEAGTVTCIAMSWNGDADLAAARAACKATTANVEETLRADPNLSGAVPGLYWVGYGTRTELIQLQAEDGACVMCVFDIAFRAKI